MKKISFKVTLNKEDDLRIELPSGAELQLFACNHSRFKLNESAFFILLKKAQPVYISADKNQFPKIEFDQVLIIEAAVYDIEKLYLVQFFIQEALDAGLKLAQLPDNLTKIPQNIYKACAKSTDEILSALTAFGIKLEKKKYVPAKAQHRWKKALAGIEFHIDYEGAKAQVIWQKASEMRILAGATMLPDTLAPRRKDGSLGIQATFTASLRQVNQAKWNAENWTTTEDIILRSVNEVGHFLYFAGTNSWLQMVDENGKSIHEWAVV
ncbi:hypothetical protein [Lactococcus sp.]|uniref:hypothetical protein n=1 Tax=Lactococcus sp. TaxID=44273 RepID=UPI0035B48EED